MKKLFFVGAMALFTAVTAQEYKPTAGDVTVDLGVSGGLGDTSINLANQGFGAGPMFKARYFKTDKLAYRATFIVGNTSTTNNSVTDVVSKEKEFGLGLGFGIEKHFTGTERLSPYIGADVLVGFTNNQFTKTETLPGMPVYVTEQKGPNNFSFGVRGVFGADYYFAKRVFLGVEAGLGLMYQSEGDITYKSTGNPDVTTKGGSDFTITPAVVTGIRVGYAF